MLVFTKEFIYLNNYYEINNIAPLLFIYILYNNNFYFNNKNLLLGLKIYYISLICALFKNNVYNILNIFSYNTYYAHSFINYSVIINLLNFYKYIIVIYTQFYNIYSELNASCKILNVNMFYTYINTYKTFKLFIYYINTNFISLIITNMHLFIKYKHFNRHIYNIFVNNLLHKNFYKIICMSSINIFNTFIKYINVYKYILKKLLLYNINIKCLNKIYKFSVYITEKLYNVVVIDGVIKQISDINYLYILFNKLVYFYKINLIYTLNSLVNNTNYLIKFEALYNLIVGQKEALKSIISDINKQNDKYSVKNYTKPKGSWFLCGPSGTGKTETVKLLNKMLSGYNLFKLDMSEFMEKHSVSKLLGSPPGYIGYNNGSVLINHLNLYSNSIILFDEVEKAHTDIYNILLQVLDEGVLTDSSNKKAYFYNSYIFFTSNLGCPKSVNFYKSYKHNKSLLKKEFYYVKNKILFTVNEYFKPELLNRINKFVVFKPLTINDIYNILNKFLNIVYFKLYMLNIKIYLFIDIKIKILISKLSYNPILGARPLKLYVDFLIEKPVLNLLKCLCLNNIENVIVYIYIIKNNIKYNIKYNIYILKFRK